MRYFSLIVLTNLLLLFSAYCYGQQNSCKVLIPEIAEMYEGSCKNGLAHKKGIARGTDTYEGYFRKGLPHGNGSYTWSNGDVYTGRWRNGKRHGKGTFTFIQTDSLKRYTGLWKNDIYIGEEKVPPYSVGHVINLKKFTIRKIKDGDMVLVTIYTNNLISKPSGDFNFSIDTGSTVQVGQSYGFENVTFPSTIYISYTHNGMFRVRFEVVINEPGVWEIRLYN